VPAAASRHRACLDECGVSLACVILGADWLRLGDGVRIELAAPIASVP
jgi:hypothetical protein